MGWSDTGDSPEISPELHAPWAGLGAHFRSDRTHPLQTHLSALLHNRVSGWTHSDSRKIPGEHRWIGRPGIGFNIYEEPNQPNQPLNYTNRRPWEGFQ